MNKFVIAENWAGLSFILLLFVYLYILDVGGEERSVYVERNTRESVGYRCYDGKATSFKQGKKGTGFCLECRTAIADRLNKMNIGFRVNQR